MMTTLPNLIIINLFRFSLFFFKGKRNATIFVKINRFFKGHLVFPQQTLHLETLGITHYFCLHTRAAPACGLHCTVDRRVGDTVDHY